MLFFEIFVRNRYLYFLSSRYIGGVDGREPLAELLVAGWLESKNGRTPYGVRKRTRDFSSQKIFARRVFSFSMRQLEKLSHGTRIFTMKNFDSQNYFSSKISTVIFLEKNNYFFLAEKDFSLIRFDEIKIFFKKKFWKKNFFPWLRPWSCGQLFFGTNFFAS